MRLEELVPFSLSFEKEVKLKPGIPDLTIVGVFCERLGVQISSQGVLGNTRKKEMVIARHLLFHVFRNAREDERGEPYSFNKIGKIMGGKHHTTVMYGVAKVQRAIDFYEVQDQEIRASNFFPEYPLFQDWKKEWFYEI